MGQIGGETMKKVQIDPATQRRPASRKQQRNAKIRQSLTQQVEVQVIPALEDMEGYLCLHLAWYLASWGMLRNSFLMQKDYKIHAAVVRVLYQPEWEALWDIDPEKLAQEWYATRIMKLCEAITEAYVDSGAGIPTETLLTKILLGTIGCAPAYDRYFKKALSLTGAAQQRCNVQSLMALGKLYISRLDEFEALRKHCSERVEYPAAKIIDMCFFEYGFQNDSDVEE